MSSVVCIDAPGWAEAVASATLEVANQARAPEAVAGRAQWPGLASWAVPSPPRAARGACAREGG